MASELIAKSFQACRISVNIDVSAIVWRSQPPRACSLMSRYALEAGSTRLARKMDMKLASKMAELLKTLKRRLNEIPVPIYMYTYVFAVFTSVVDIDLNLFD